MWLLLLAITSCYGWVDWQDFCPGKGYSTKTLINQWLEENSIQPSQITSLVIPFENTGTFETREIYSALVSDSSGGPVGKTTSVYYTICTRIYYISSHNITTKLPNIQEELIRTMIPKSSMSEYKLSDFLVLFVLLYINWYYIRKIW